MKKVKEEKLNKSIVRFLDQNFPPYASYNILSLNPINSKVELVYGPKDKIIVEIGTGIEDESSLKLLSTVFV